MPQTPQDHQKWFNALLAGDERALRFFSDQFSGFLLGFILKIVKDKSVAEELMSDAVMRLWELRDILASPTHLRIVLFLTAKWLALNFLRKQKVERKGIEIL